MHGYVRLSGQHHSWRKTQEEHDANLEKFLKVAKDCNLTLNKDKCVVQMLDSSYYYVTMGFVVQLCFALSFACTVVFRLSKLSSV